MRRHAIITRANALWGGGAGQKCMHSVVATSVNFVQRVIPLAAAGQIEKLTFSASLLQEVALFCLLHSHPVAQHEE